ncbi:MAG: hypothetical protein CMJ58_15065 [Planctomycetaceae bacterium]|nr:hypothetical protein [Planctomycetaceae bacterium]
MNKQTETASAADLARFTHRVREALRSALETPRWSLDEAEKYMTDYADRRQAFEDVVQRLNVKVIQPRVVEVASYFSNASLIADEHPNRIECRFASCQRFPAKTNLEFSIEHDVRFEKIVIRVQTRMVPALVRFVEHDRFVVALDALADNEVVDWVEDRLLEFLDSYVRIDGGSDGFPEEPATDPVCGMRIRRTVAASDSYRGRLYYFCCESCRIKFNQDPSQYVPIDEV